MKDIYNDEYLPSIIKTGRIILSISAVVFFVPFLATWFIYGVQPRWDAILPGVSRLVAYERVMVVVRPHLLLSRPRRSRNF